MPSPWPHTAHLGNILRTVCMPHSMHVLCRNTKRGWTVVLHTMTTGFPWALAAAYLHTLPVPEAAFTPDPVHPWAMAHAPQAKMPIMT